MGGLLEKNGWEREVRGRGRQKSTDFGKERKEGMARSVCVYEGGRRKKAMGLTPLVPLVLQARDNRSNERSIRVSFKDLQQTLTF